MLALVAILHQVSFWAVCIVSCPRGELHDPLFSPEETFSHDAVSIGMVVTVPRTTRASETQSDKLTKACFSRTFPMARGPTFERQRCKHAKIYGNPRSRNRCPIMTKEQISVCRKICCSKRSHNGCLSRCCRPARSLLN